MSAPVAFVYVDLRGTPRFVGRLWAVAQRGRQSATFEYDAAWLAQPERFALEPALTLDPGPFHTVEGRALFGAIGDSAPDRWGRSLIAAAERHRAKREGRRPRELREIDYLLGVSDITRPGALRFAGQMGGAFVAHESEAAVPPLVALPRLLRASEHLESDRESDADLAVLLAPGSSLGGARPKASVRDHDGQLSIAKFPSKSDAWRVIRWEAVALTLAHWAGIVVPTWRIEEVAGHDVLLVRRFDRRLREGAGAVSLVERVPFLSAMSMLDAVDRAPRSYLEIADSLRRYGAETATDIAQLWRRVVFNVLISNTDDHLRNHGFLYAGPDGWRLAPAYDLNPVPTDVKPRFLSTAIGLDDDLSASLDVALSVAPDFDVALREARQIAGEIAAVVAEWRNVASTMGLAGAACDRMATAFEHEDLEIARGFLP